MIVFFTEGFGELVYLKRDFSLGLDVKAVFNSFPKLDSLLACLVNVVAPVDCCVF